MFWLDFGARGRENIANNAVLFLVGTENTVYYNVLCSLWYLGGGPCGAEKVIISCPTGTPCQAEKMIISCPTGNYLTWRRRRRQQQQQQQEQQEQQQQQQQQQNTYTNRNYDLVPGSIAGFAKPINIFIVHDDDISFLSLKVEIFLHRPLTSASKAQRPKAQNYRAIIFLIDWCCSLLPLSAFWCVGSKSKIEISHCEHRSAKVCEVVAFLKSSPRSCHIQSCNRRQHGSIDENVIWGKEVKALIRSTRQKASKNAHLLHTAQKKMAILSPSVGFCENCPYSRRLPSQGANLPDRCNQCTLTLASFFYFEEPRLMCIICGVPHPTKSDHNWKHKK